MRLMLSILLVFLQIQFAFSLNAGHCSVDGCNESSTYSRMVLGRIPHPLNIETQNEFINNIYFSIKSTEKYHESRLHPLLLTWFQTIPPQNLHIVTDSEDDTTELLREYSYWVHIADCPKSHSHNSLACKCGVEFEQFYLAKEKEMPYKWYCHLDDDMYLNVQNLLQLLNTLDPLSAHYLGKRSINTKIDVRESFKLNFEMARDSYYFATGAIYCISASLMELLEQYLRGKDNMMKLSKMAGIPDDMVLGLVIEAVLGYNMTEVSTMTSHLFSLKQIPTNSLRKQITISYGTWTIKGEAVKNIISLKEGLFTESEDPTRFLSYHCLLYPTTKWCKSKDS